MYVSHTAFTWFVFNVVISHPTNHVAGLKLNPQCMSALGSSAMFIVNTYSSILINDELLKLKHSVASLLFDMLCVITPVGGISSGFAFAYDIFRLFTAGTNLVRTNPKLKKNN